MKKIHKIWGVGLIAILLVSLLGAAVPASAGTLSWTTETIPSGTNQIVGDYDVYDMAIAPDGTIWVASGTHTLYKSTDGGATWSTTTDSDFTDEGIDLIAVAPDNSEIIAVAQTDNCSVYISTNGGDSFSTLGDVQEGTSDAASTLTDLVISAASGGKNYVAVSGDDGSLGNVWYFDLGSAAPVWSDIEDKGGFHAVTTAGSNCYGDVDSVVAIAFSPNFASDKVLTAVSYSDNGSTDNIAFEIYSFAHGKWNQAASFDSYPNVFISTSSDLTAVNAADISLSPTYLGSDDTEMVAFTALDISTGGTTDYSGIWRHKNVADTHMKTDSANSVAFDGTNLVAGAYDSNEVWYCSDPLVSSSYTVSTARSNKRPGYDGGTPKTVVAWSDAIVVAGTQGTESAFAVSEDNGKTFVDISLIDTTITNIRDIAVAADGSVIYMLTDDNSTYLSLWRKAGSWQRVLTVADTDYIVRISPTDPDVVYVGEKSGTTLYYSNNGGLEKWFARTCGSAITDLAVESADVVYVMDSDGDVKKSTNAGFTWGSSKDGKVGSGYMLLCVSEDNLIIGGGDGYVSYSTDGGSTFTKISKIVEADATNIVVAADTDYANNGMIYAATENTSGSVSIERWEVGESAAWDDIVSNTIDTVMGLRTISGALYAITSDSTDSTMLQCLTPTTASSSTTWGSEELAAKDLINAPQAFQVSSGSNKIWAVNTEGTDSLYSYTDTLAGGGPTLLSPVDGYSNPVNTVTGIANDMSFTWERLSKATSYTLYIAYDSSFKENAISADTVSDSHSTVARTVGPNGDTDINWIPGQTYYWRVKASAPLYSAYSETRMLVIEPGAAMVPSILAPENGKTDAKQMPSFSWSPVSGSTEYQFKLADNPAMTSPIVDATVTTTGYAVTSALDYGKTYYWTVKPLAPVEGNWSTIANFTVMDEPVATSTQAPITITQVPAPTFTIPAAEPAATITIPPIEQPAQIAPAYIWAVIIIGAVLVIAVIVLIVRTRRTV